MKKKGKKKITLPHRRIKVLNSLWMMTKTKVQRQNEEVLELRRKTIVTNTMRPFQETTHHLTEYHYAYFYFYFFGQVALETRFRKCLSFKIHKKKSQPVKVSLLTGGHPYRFHYSRELARNWKSLWN